MFQKVSVVKKSVMVACCLSTMLFLMPLYFALSATETFTIPVLVGSDVTPPTVPGNFTATPVATTQIDLLWDVSTDNFLLSGYHIWRDNVRIATTTLTTYSDTGLSASTTYTYYVTAFDSVFNESASSSLVATTTLSPAPLAPTSTPSTTQNIIYGSRTHPLAEEITAISIFPERDAVVIRYTTKNKIRASVGWGVGPSYEEGTLIEEAFSQTHRSRIENLLPGTVYYFTLEGENAIGKTGGMYSGTFKTLPPLDIFPPENVSQLTARIEGDDVVLNWENPHDTDFEKVRVVRNDRFYPNDIADGRVVYEGEGTGVRDTGILSETRRQYYTVFAYDALGNISSGAVVSVYRKESATTTEVIPRDTEFDPLKNPIALTWEDLQFIQEGTRLIARDGAVTIDGSKQLSIALPYDRVPEHLKTILVSIDEGISSDRSFTFLLRINAEKTGYVGTIAPFGISGTFPVQLSVFDYTTAQIGYVRGLIESTITSMTVEKRNDGFFARMVRMFAGGEPDYIALIATVWMLLALVILAFLGRRIMAR